MLASEEALASGLHRVKSSASTSTHVGTDANSTGAAVQFASQPTTIGLAVFSALGANGSVPVYLGRGEDVTASTGIELASGNSITLPCDNIDEWWVFSASSTHCHAVAL